MTVGGHPSNLPFKQQSADISTQVVSVRKDSSTRESQLCQQSCLAEGRLKGGSVFMITTIKVRSPHRGSSNITTATLSTVVQALGRLLQPDGLGLGNALLICKPWPFSRL